MVADKRLNKMIVEAQQITESIVEEKDKIYSMAKEGKDTTKEMRELTKLIDKGMSIAAQISDMQNTIIESKEAEKFREKNARISEKINKVSTEEVINRSAVAEQEQQQISARKRQRESTINQIKASELPSSYQRSSGSETAGGAEWAEGNQYRCTWHPWRQAYEVCNYCHRPFCFEDIVEKRGKFYCLEDVDKTPAPGAKAEHSYESLNIVGAGLLMISFIVFIYFGYSQFVYQATNLVEALPSITNGFTVLLKFANPVSIFSLFGALFTFIGFISGITVLGHNNKAFITGIIAGTLSTAMFSYAYLSYTQTYALIISVFSFVSMIMLLLSKGSEFTSIEQQEEADYSNVNLTNISTY